MSYYEELSPFLYSCNVTRSGSRRTKFALNLAGLAARNSSLNCNSRHVASQNWVTWHDMTWHDMTWESDVSNAPAAWLRNQGEFIDWCVLLRITLIIEFRTISNDHYSHTIQYMHTGCFGVLLVTHDRFGKTWFEYFMRDRYSAELKKTEKKKRNRKRKIISRWSTFWWV